MSYYKLPNRKKSAYKSKAKIKHMCILMKQLNKEVEAT